MQKAKSSDVQMMMKRELEKERENEERDECIKELITDGLREREITAVYYHLTTQKWTSSEVPFSMGEGCPYPLMGEFQETIHETRIKNGPVFIRFLVLTPTDERVKFPSNAGIISVILTGSVIDNPERSIIHAVCSRQKKPLEKLEWTPEHMGFLQYEAREGVKSPSLL